MRLLVYGRQQMAIKVGEKYVYEVRGNEVVVTNAGKGVLVCCRVPMKLFSEGFDDK